jgi:hypothetical protein
MFFSKPVNALTYEDIASLTSTGEPESPILDYKARLEGEERDKKELAKDVSAMANSSGGYIVIGVAEKQGKPVHPPCGTARMIGHQKVEEWIEQILMSNVAQRPPVVIRAVPLEGDADKCVVVVNTPVSSRAPHMVTVPGDNRYYRRYFKRQQYQSLPAEEYEVREMFERSARLRSETEQYLAGRNCLDVTASNFAENSLSRRLYMTETTATGPALTAAQSFVTFVSCPDTLVRDAIDTIGDELWHWLQPMLRLYLPVGDSPLPLGDKRTVFEGLLLTEEYARDVSALWESYVFVAGNGFAEMGLSLARRYQGQMHFPLVHIVGRFWQFLGLVTDLYRAQGLLRPFTVMLNMKGTLGSILVDLADGWPGPTEYRMLREPLPNCLETNLQFVLNMRNPDVTPDDIERLVREIAPQIDAAYGSRDLRSFNHPKKDPNRAFPHQKVCR